MNKTLDKEKQKLISDRLSHYQMREINEHDLKRIRHLIGHAPSEVEKEAFSIWWSEEKSHEKTLGLTHLLAKGNSERESNVFVSKPVKIFEDTEVILYSSECRDQFARSNPLAGVLAFERSLGKLAANGFSPLAAGLLLRVGSIQNADQALIIRKLLSYVGKYANRQGLPLAVSDIYGHSSFQGEPVCIAHAVGARKADVIPEIKTGNVLVYLGNETRAFSPKENCPPIDLYPDEQISSSLRQVLLSARNHGFLKRASMVFRGGLYSALFSLAEKSNRGISLGLDRIPSPDKEICLSRQLLRSEDGVRALGIMSNDSYNDLVKIADVNGIPLAIVGEVIDVNEIHVIWKNKSILEVPWKRVAKDVHPIYYDVLITPPMLKENPRHSIEESLTSIEDGEGEDIEKTESELEEEQVESELFGNAGMELEEPVYFEDTWIDMLGCINIFQDDLLEQISDRLAGGVLQKDKRAATVFRLPDESLGLFDRGFALGVDSSSLAIVNDHYLGSAHAVGRVMCQLASVGTMPKHLYLSCHLGDPSYYRERCSFTEIMRGISDACDYWDLPVSCSLLTIPEKGARYRSWPVIQVCGIGEVISTTDLPLGHFPGNDFEVYVLGELGDLPGCGEYAAFCHNRIRGHVCDLDYDFEIKICRFLISLIEQKILDMVLPAQSGGLGVALEIASLRAEKPTGVILELFDKGNNLRTDGVLLGENPGVFIVACKSECASILEAATKEFGIKIAGKGKTGGRKISITGAITAHIQLTTAYRVWKERLSAEIYNPTSNFM